MINWLQLNHFYEFKCFHYGTGLFEIKFFWKWMSFIISNYLKSLNLFYGCCGLVTVN